MFGGIPERMQIQNEKEHSAPIKIASRTSMKLELEMGVNVRTGGTVCSVLFLGHGLIQTQ